MNLLGIEHYTHYKLQGDSLFLGKTTINGLPPMTLNPFDDDSFLVPI
jgi:hypothetical protein